MAAQEISFSGIDGDGLQFLRDLKKHNDRDWFRKRKHVYEEKLKRPAEALVFEAAAAARKRGFPLFAKEKSPLTRIYRDIRFSPDKRPFQTYIGAMLRGSPQKSSLGEIYIHIDPEVPFVAAGFWMPERPFLQAWRERMAAAPGDYLKVLKTLDKNKVDWLNAHSLKRLPRGWESQAGTPLEEHFKRQVFIVRRALTVPQLASAALVDRIADFSIAARPLLEYGWSLPYRPKRDVLESD